MEPAHRQCRPALPPSICWAEPMAATIPPSVVDCGRWANRISGRNMQELLIATTNVGKAREFRQMLGEDRFIWPDPASAGALEVEETGRTFRDNACLKAAAYAVH